MGGESGTDQTFCGENATPLGTSTDVVWVDRAVATIGTTDGTPHRASQPSIIMHPDSAMPTGPSRTQRTRTTSVARREPLMICESPARTLGSQVLAAEKIAANPYHGEAACLGYRQPPLPTRHPSDLRELTRLDHLNEDVPFLLLEDREITGFTDADLIASKLHFGAQPTSRGAQQHFPSIQGVHLLPFTIFSRSM